jgi:hypothetical protein
MVGGWTIGAVHVRPTYFPPATAAKTAGFAPQTGKSVENVANGQIVPFAAVTGNDEIASN